MPKRAETAFARKLRLALRPYPANGCYLIGISGGRDSVALLHGLITTGYRNLTVCHLDHGLRGQESREDAEFVRRLAGERGLPVEVEEADVAALARSEKLSLETAAREARYRFFARVAERLQCRTLFLAHQADDQAETVLFNLLRGAGPVGLSGMRVANTRQIESVELRIVRPMLAIWRAEVDAYLLAGAATWREDATNADPAFGTRNRLRLEALPMLADVMGRDVKPALWRAAELIGEEAASREEAPPSEQLSVRILRAQPVVERRRTVRQWLQGRGVSGVGYREVEAVLSMVEDRMDVPAKVNLPGGHHARRRAGAVFLERRVITPPDKAEVRI